MIDVMLRHHRPGAVTAAIGSTLLRSHDLVPEDVYSKAIINSPILLTCCAAAGGRRKTEASKQKESR